MYIFFFSDIDECNNGTHNCSQICTNTNGSFTCGCNNGYLLNIDEVTCNGMQINLICNTCLHLHIMCMYKIVMCLCTYLQNTKKSCLGLSALCTFSAIILLSNSHKALLLNNTKYFPIIPNISHPRLTDC